MAKGTYDERFGAAFQRHILAVAARLPGFVIRYRSALDHAYFSAALDRAIAQALLTHVDKHMGLPTQVTLVQDSRDLCDAGTADKVEELVGKLYKADISDANAVMEKAVEFGKTQAMINAVLRGAEEIDKGNRNILPLIQDAELVGEDILNIGVDYKDELEDRMERYLMPPEERGVEDLVPTGIAHLDFALEGGLGRGELGVFVAPPKKGKSTCLVNVAFGALCSTRGYNVVHYTSEMSERRVERRYDARLVEKAVKYKKTNMPAFIARLKSRMQKLVHGTLVVKEYPTRTATPTTLRTHLSLLSSRGFTPDLIIVDYADIMKPERRLGEMRHEQAGIYEDLRRMAGEFKAAVWTGSQAPRRVLEKETLDIGDFAEAFEKAAIVDTAVAFCQSTDERLLQECRLVLIGARNVEDGRIIRCHISRPQCLIRSVQLLDPTLAPVETPFDEGGNLPHVKTSVALHVTTKKLKQSGKQGGKKKKRVRDKPTKKVRLKGSPESG